MSNIIRLRTPFFAAKKFVGIHPGDCIMIDKEQFELIELKQGEDAEIIFDINYKNMTFNVKEKRVITVGEIKQLLDKNIARIRFNVSTSHYGINLNRKNCRLLEDYI